MRSMLPDKNTFQRLSSHLIWLPVTIFATIGIFAPFIANDQPYFVKSGDHQSWPLFDGKVFDLKAPKIDQIVFAPVPFDHQGYTKIASRLLPPGAVDRDDPFNRKHLLGTDRLGRDVAAGIIYGCRKSIFIALLTMSFAAMVGIVVGASAGYWGNHLPLYLSWKLMPLFGLFLYVVYLAWYAIVPFWIATLFFILIIIFYAKENARHNLKQSFPLDLVVVKTIEVFQSIPALLLIMLIASLIRTPSLVTLALLLGMIRWTTFARYARAEVIKIKARDYITAAKISGISSFRIITRYIMPEAFGPLVVIFAFGISSVILLESTLSFLGIGIPVDEVTWGTLLSQARRYSSAWWLAVFPGLCIFLLVLNLNLIGTRLKERFNPQD